jgi:hypothetical protein
VARVAHAEAFERGDRNGFLRRHVVVVGAYEKAHEERSEHVPRALDARHAPGLDPARRAYSQREIRLTGNDGHEHAREIARVVTAVGIQKDEHRRL